MDDVAAYYLAECLRYTHRGLGLFPDSDGMFMQLNYLHAVGALELMADGAAPRLVSDPGAVIAGLRSLARTLADSVLDDQPELALRLFDTYGPAAPQPLAPLLTWVGERPAASVEYVSEHIRRQA